MGFEEDVYNLIDNAYEFIDGDVFTEQEEKNLKARMKKFDTPMYVNRLAVPQLFVKNFVSYDRRNISTPRGLGDTANKLRGDCVDQSILLASVYESFGHRTRIRSIDVTGGGGPHMILEVKSERDVMETISGLKKFYENYSLFTIFDPEIWPAESSTDSCWFPVDPTSSQYVGDIQTLKFNGYIDIDSATKPPNTNWSYSNLLLTENIDEMDLDGGENTSQSTTPKSTSTHIKQENISNDNKKSNMTTIAFVCDNCGVTGNVSFTNMDQQRNSLTIQCGDCGVKGTIGGSRPNTNIQSYCYECETYNGMHFNLVDPQTMYIECRTCGNTIKVG